MPITARLGDKPGSGKGEELGINWDGVLASKGCKTTVVLLNLGRKRVPINSLVYFSEIDGHLLIHPFEE
jgi:hypothetical protein